MRLALRGKLRKIPDPSFMELNSIIEALLFASQEPLGVGEMQRALIGAVNEAVEVAKEEGREVDDAKLVIKNVTEEQIRAALDALADHYEKDGRAFTIVERSTGWRICAKGQYGEWCRALYPGKKPQRLSQPAVETLAIIAYRQPITKSAIEAVRGVSVDTMVQQLLDRGFVKIDGRADLPGRPLLYSTTDMFLDHFGVRTLDDLPNAAELRRVKLPTPEEAQAKADGESDGDSSGAAEEKAESAEAELGILISSGEFDEPSWAPDSNAFVTNLRRPFLFGYSTKADGLKSRAYSKSFAMKPPPSVQKALNEQIKNELQAHYNYLGMSAHFEDSPYLGFAKWMRAQATEEHMHAMKVFDFLRERNVTIELSGLDAPQTKFGPQPLEVFEIALAQERRVTAQINGIYELALNEKDYPTLQFLTWFLQEQVEEENTVSDIIDRLRLAADNAAGLLRLDAESGRQAVMPPPSGGAP